MSDKNFVVFHCHTDFSLLDSCTDFKLYVDRAVELGQKAIAFTEHGKPLSWIAKKIYCDKMGIKYLHGVECYLTEKLKWYNSETNDYGKLRDNYHTVLIAKNYAGVLEINKAISLSCDEEHHYYTNRITFDEFFKLSKNVIKISACLASPLNKLPIDHPQYEKLVRHYDYLEIQPHSHPEQVQFNAHLATLAQKYKKPLIAGTDTHSLNAYKAECRDILLIAKNKKYDDDGFDLTYKTYDELVKAFEVQATFPSKIYLEAIENTNVMADSVEEFELDMSLKYPILYGSREKDKEIFAETIERKFQEKVRSGIIPEHQIEAYRAAMPEEQRVFSKIEMDGFMLSMSELLSWCNENGIPYGFARGSVAGSRVAYVTDVIDLNPETWHTVFSRFANESRKEVGDIDIDVIESDRPKIFEYIVGRFGKTKTARVPSFGTCADKGTIDEIGRALKSIWDDEHPEKNDENPYSLAVIDGIKNEFASNPDKAREKHPDIFYYFDGLVGTRVSQSVHPAGMVISPITLADNYGVFQKDEDLCLFVDMEECHECGLVKYDFLILRNVQIIRDTYNLLGKSYPKSHEIDWDDDVVWCNMLKSATGIFQFEGEYAFSLLRQFEPHSIFDMSLVTAALRPSGASYRNELIRHIPYKNPSPIIDELLAENNGYLVYQEDIIKFLQRICGLSGSDADNVRRAIARKQEDRLKEALPQILEGYCEKSNQPRDIAEREAQTFLEIIEDASSYMFGYNHSVAYCMIGYICALLRHYHPYEFITAFLNNAANEDDINSGTQMAQEFGIVMSPPRYGLSNDQYFFDKEKKVIAKGVSSIKYLNVSAANELYELAHRLSTESFMDVLMGIKNETSTNSRQLDILIKIDYFIDYGNVNELSRIREVFDLFKQGDSKTINRDKLTPNTLEIIKDYITNVNAKGKELKTYTIKDMTGMLYALEKHIRGLKLPDLSMRVRVANSLECLGYIGIQTGIPEDRKKLVITDVKAMTSKKNNEVWGYRVGTQSLGTGKSARLTVRANVFKKRPIVKGDLVYASKVSKNESGYWYIDAYEKVV